MDELEKQFNNLEVVDKRNIKTFINFIQQKYPEKQYPIIYDLYDDDKKWLTSNGGSWYRDATKSKYKIFTCSNTNKIKIKWSCTDTEKQHITELVSKLSFENRRKTQNSYIGIYSDDKDEDKSNRGIREDIKKIIRIKPCLHCGKQNDTIVDHKNDLYNDPRVLNMKTQTKDDFQPLCNGCNLIKKAYNIKMLLPGGKRFDALELQLPIIKKLGVSYTKGNETFNIKDVNTLEGVYWTDIEDFTEKAFAIYKLKNS
jgi:5-methylcytosine-specific restriction endonuclease McrA